MSELYEKSLVKLELNQVLAMLADCAGSEGGKEACLKLRPTSDLEEVEQMLGQKAGQPAAAARMRPGEIHLSGGVGGEAASQ